MNSLIWKRKTKGSISRALTISQAQENMPLSYLIYIQEGGYQCLHFTKEEIEIQTESLNALLDFKTTDLQSWNSPQTWFGDRNLRKGHVPKMQNTVKQSPSGRRVEQKRLPESQRCSML